ncbi:MAG: hypothetical protein H7Y15_04370 [Pseudonocardia sp.]|nr:hypothetical protein [Pseudonocardia sp.]
MDNRRHRRAKTPTPTADGRAALAEVHTAHEDWVRRTAADLTSVDVDALTAALRRIDEAVLAGPPVANHQGTTSLR